jgi:hypothetical protein
MSGWSQRRVAIIAPRRAPVESMVAHIASHIRMNDTGPEAMLPLACSHRAGRPQGGKVVADTAAVLHGERAFLQRLEDAGQVVGDFAHDEAVEQRHPVSGAGAGKNAAAGEEAKILQQMVEALRPPFRVLLLRRCDRLRHAPPAVADARLAGEAIARPPDVA